MSKKNTLIALIIIALVGSFVTFYASNLFFSDIGNIDVGFSKGTFLASIPALMFGAMFVTGALYLTRLYMRPKTLKRLSSTYLFVVMGLSFVGFLTALLAGIMTYGSLVAPYPFPGYILVAMIFHLIVLGSAIFLLFKLVKPLPEDEEKFKVGPKHVFHTLGLFLLIALAFNRFGAFMFMPFYVSLKSFGKTFVFYLFLLIPMALLIYKAAVIFELKLNRFIYAIVVAALNIVLFAVVAILGKSDTSFISAVSPAMPLERLASMPVEILIHFTAQLATSIYYVIREILNKKNSQ